MSFSLGVCSIRFWQLFAISVAILRCLCDAEFTGYQRDPQLHRRAELCATICGRVVQVGELQRTDCGHRLDVPGRAAGDAALEAKRLQSREYLCLLLLLLWL